MSVHYLHGTVGMELAPDLNIKTLRATGSFGGVGKNHLWWVAWPQTQRGHPRAACCSSCPLRASLYKNQLANPDIKPRPYKALVQFILKERRGSTPTQDKDGSFQPQEILLHKNMGLGEEKDVKAGERR